MGITPFLQTGVIAVSLPILLDPSPKLKTRIASFPKTKKNPATWTNWHRSQSLPVDVAAEF
jgi:hypothetical protein